MSGPPCFRPLNKVHVAVFFMLLTSTTKVSGQNWVLSKLLPVGYNKLQVPLQSNFDNDTLAVNGSITLNSFSVTEKTQTLTVDMFLCLNWTDYRLQSLDFTPNSVPGLDINSTLHLSQVKLTKFDSLWKPILYFRNSLSASTISPLNSIEYVQVWPDRKLVKYCSRMSVNFICHMELANFPFDEHYCHFELESFEKAAQRLRIHMNSVNGVKGSAKFRVRNTYTGACDPISYYPFENRGLKSLNTTSHQGNCAYGGVRLVRSINYYVIRYYCPTFLMVAMGYVSFWLPTNAWPARIILTASVLLTLITTSLQGYNEVPANDVVSLYWWLWGCQFLMYMSMLEYVLALSWVNLMTDKKVAKAASKESPDGHYFGKKGWFSKCGIGFGKFIQFVFGQVDHHRDPQNRNKVDYIARIIFPLILLVFVIVYIVATIPVWANKWRW